MTNDFEYIGDELEIFALALNWKNYFKSRIEQYIAGDVLEVGAGIGATTKFLFNDSVKSWTALEPDRGLIEGFESGLVSPKISKMVGTISDLGDDSFDTILYIDVLEHIEDDRNELVMAANKLRKGGKLIVLSPAFQFLFSEFDRKIGHFRRYTKASLSKISPNELILQEMFYLDSVACLLSFANAYFLKSSMPKRSQIVFWDSYIVPISKIVDPMFANFIGRSLIAIWGKS